MVSPHRDPATAPARLSGLDALRGLGAVGMLVLHVSMYTEPTAPPWSVGDAVLRGMALGVPMFFVLSGFLLFTPWVRALDQGAGGPELGRYALRRIARIAPAYWLALAGAALLLAGTGNARQAQWADLPVLLTLQQDLVPSVSQTLIPPAWTLGIEVMFYALLPLLGLAALRLGSLRRVLVACLALFAAGVAFNSALHAAAGPPKLHATLLGWSYAFAAGMAASVIAVRWRPGRGAAGVLVAGGAVLVAVNAAGHLPLGWLLMDLTRDALAAVGFAAVVLGLTASSGRVLSAAPLRWLGDRSYGLYLWHFPIILAFSARGQMPADLAAGVALVLPLSLLAAHLSWTLVERPAMQWSRRATRRDRRGPAQRPTPHPRPA